MVRNITRLAGSAGQLLAARLATARRRSRRLAALGALGGLLVLPALPLRGVASETVLVMRGRLFEASMALRLGNGQRGIQLIEEELAQTRLRRRDSAKALANLCAGYILIGDYGTALVHCNHSLAIDQTKWRAWNNRASAFLGQGRLDEAIADLDRGLLLEPGSAMMRDSLANAYERKGLGGAIVEPGPGV